ncbi:hypothetical protein [Iodobacter arcticus]|uniref:hypothetical protein n=1 Tax=Iodobacter arcticus TaxID=590593 RepID=UPI003A919EDC
MSVFFADAAAEYVVEVFGFTGLAADFAQTVEAIPAVFSGLFALLLFNQITASVVFIVRAGLILQQKYCNIRPAHFFRPNHVV